MRLIIVIVIILSPCLTFGQADSLQQYDSLSKYSYLLLQTVYDRPNARLAVVGHATGFFLRKGNKLFLVSAYHVFGGCDVYKGVYEDSKYEFLAVIYQDTLSNLKFQILPTLIYRSKRCDTFFNLADVDTMDVSPYFKEAKINSVENFMPTNNHKRKIFEDNRYVAWGFPEDKYEDYLRKNNNNLPRNPFGYLCQMGDSTTEDSYYVLNKWRIDSLYTSIQPALIWGASGSPVFRLLHDKKKKKMIVFAGIQSGSNFKSNRSLIVKPEELEKLCPN